jgi:hypothetical protein
MASAKWLGTSTSSCSIRRACGTARVSRRGAPTVVHVCDHSNAMYVPWLRRIPACGDVSRPHRAPDARSENSKGNERGGAGGAFKQMIRAGLRQADRIVCDFGNGPHAC